MTHQENQFLGEVWGNEKGLAVTASASMVAGAGHAECYTAPETYWIDFR